MLSVNPIPARRLNHAVLFVSDLERAITFWTSALDMTVAAREERANAAFLRLNRGENHHDLGLFGLGAGATTPQARSIGLYHLAWQVDTIDELASARQILLDLGAFHGESSHGATKSIYGADPDGNQFEIMWMLPREAWGEYENAAVVDALDLTGELERWTGVATAGAVVAQ